MTQGNYDCRPRMASFPSRLRGFQDVRGGGEDKGLRDSIKDLGL